MKYILKFSLAIFTFCFISLFNTSQAQTSVYVCSETGAYGFCYGSNDVANCALNKCKNYGGTSPSQILSMNSKGYGAVAVGKRSDGGQVVGAGAGFDNAQEASNRAIRECQSRGGQGCAVKERYFDN